MCLFILTMFLFKIRICKKKKEQSFDQIPTFRLRTDVLFADRNIGCIYYTLYFIIGIYKILI